MIMSVRVFSIYDGVHGWGNFVMGIPLTAIEFGFSTNGVISSTFWLYIE